MVFPSVSTKKSPVRFTLAEIEKNKEERKKDRKIENNKQGRKRTKRPPRGSGSLFLRVRDDTCVSKSKRQFNLLDGTGDHSNVPRAVLRIFFFIQYLIVNSNRVESHGPCLPIVSDLWNIENEAQYEAPRDVSNLRARVYVYCARVCVCVWEREREKERTRTSGGNKEKIPTCSVEGRVEFEKKRKRRKERTPHLANADGNLMVRFVSFRC